MGVANEKSAAWGIAAMAAAQGAELAFTYQLEGFRKRLAPLASSVGSDFLIPCDVAEETRTGDFCSYPDKMGYAGFCSACHWVFR